MEIDLKNDFGSLTDFARNTREQTEDLIRSGRPKVLTQNGAAALVVLSVDAFEELSAQAYEREMDMRLKKTLDDLTVGGNTSSAEDTHARIRKRAKLRRSKQS